MPNTITDTITELADNKSDIQAALVAKGVTSAGKHGFNKFASDIASITNQYSSSDEGKVVSDGTLVAQTSTTATTNGTIDTTTNNEVVVNVPNSYTQADEGKVVQSGSLVTQTSTTVSQNGTVNTTTNNQVVVDVPNSYTAQDEGKVVSNSALVAQTAMSTEITSNDTYDTTLYNSVTVNVPQGGGTSTAKKDVNFYDYDGTVVASYTATEFAELTALPENPTHEGLTSQGWNWTLSDAKTYVATYGKLNVGQMYITSDGKTRLYIELTEGRLNPYLGLFGDSSGTAVSIDWGDNSATESVTLNADTVYTPHEYAAVGDYVITITITNGNIRFRGNDSADSNIFRKSASPNRNDDKIYQNILTKIEIGSSVTSIDSNAFKACRSLHSVTIPNSVTTIGYSSFSGCYSLTSVTIPNSITTIQNDLFSGCYSLTSVTIPNSITTIGNSWFTECYSLTSVTIPNSVTTIGSSLFNNCTTLTSVTIPNSVTTIGSSLFNNCTALTSVTIPNSVTTIGNNLSANCRSLHSVTIPNSVTTIGSSAFSGCYSLTSVTIPNSITTINANFVNDCTTLTSVTIPSGVTTIGNNALGYCYGLAFIKFSSSTPPTVTTTTFTSLSTDCIIYVPTGSLSAYTSASNYPSSSTYTYVEY